MEFNSRQTTDSVISSADYAKDPTKVMFKTSEGDIIFSLYSNAAPLTTRTFLKRIETNYYDGCSFYKVGGGRLYGGCAHDKREKEVELGTLEYKLSNKLGRVSMDRTLEEWKPSSTEFFINLQDNSEILKPGGLDPHGFGVFMDIDIGLDTVNKIVAKGSAKINSVHLVKASDFLPKVN